MVLKKNVLVCYIGDACVRLFSVNKFFFFFPAAACPTIVCVTSADLADMLKHLYSPNRAVTDLADQTLTLTVTNRYTFVYHTINWINLGRALIMGHYYFRLQKKNKKK